MLCRKGGERFRGKRDLSVTVKSFKLNLSQCRYLSHSFSVVYLGQALQGSTSWAVSFSVFLHCYCIWSLPDAAFFRFCFRALPDMILEWALQLVFARLLQNKAKPRMPLIELSERHLDAFLLNPKAAKIIFDILLLLNVTTWPYFLLLHLYFGLIERHSSLLWSRFWVCCACHLRALVLNDLLCRSFSCVFYSLTDTHTQNHLVPVLLLSHMPQSTSKASYHLLSIYFG